MRWEQLQPGRHAVDGGELFARVSPLLPGRPTLVLLHGFPQTHRCWQRVVEQLGDRFNLVLPDLRGYGDSLQPPGASDHRNYSKRTMGADIVALADALGVSGFLLAGHDRGGRVAHRLALDHPDRVLRMALLDIAPTLDMYEHTDMEFARAYEHWFNLIQPPPLPERMIAGCARDYLHAKLGGWGAGGLEHIDADTLTDYQRCFERPPATPEGLPPTIHAMCEDYRASAGIDLQHDRESRASGQRIDCDLLVLWGARGVVDRFFDVPALWRAQCSKRLITQRLDAGHYLPEERPRETAEALVAFFDV